MFKVDNAIILAAGTSSRFAPLSFEKHKALTVVKNEVLIERQINQLIDAGIHDIYIITGYKSEQFNYLTDKYQVKLINNPEYLTRNNNGSIWAAKDILNNSYVCSSDNYFSINPFENIVDDSYYAAEYAEGYTDEWCMTEDEHGYINSVTIGGKQSWFMMGHTFWNHTFSRQFITILKSEYNIPETRNKLWEKIFMSHLDNLKMKIRHYPPNTINEFDSLDDLRDFDASYINNTRSQILKELSQKLNVEEKEIVGISALKGETAESIGFEFYCNNKHFKYNYNDKRMEECK